MNNPGGKPRRSWSDKFRDSFRGIVLGVHGQSSFVVHFVCTLLVIAGAVLLRVTLAEWCLLILCIALVLTAEMFNSALEALAKAIDDQHNRHLGAGLDIASSAVLVAAAGATIVGAIVFLYRATQLLG